MWVSSHLLQQKLPFPVRFNSKYGFLLPHPVVVHTTGVCKSLPPAVMIFLPVDPNRPYHTTKNIAILHPLKARLLEMNI